MQAIRSIITDYFSVFLLGSFVAGLFIPGAEHLPKWVVPALLGAIIFFSCSKITIADLRDIRLRDVAGFYVFRFVMIPFCIYGLAVMFLPDYQYMLLMLALIPCGATMPAMADIMKGNGSLGLAALTVTSIISPFAIPWAFAMVSDVQMDLDVWGMFRTLALIIFLPIILYFPLVRRIEPVKLAMRENASMVAIILIMFVIVIVISTYRSYFFTDFLFLLEATAVGFAAFSFFFVLGWFMGGRHDLKMRITYGLISGSVNIALGISLAFLYLPEREKLMMVMGEIPWIVTLSAFQLFVKRQYRKVGG